MNRPSVGVTRLLAIAVFAGWLAMGSGHAQKETPGSNKKTGSEEGAAPAKMQFSADIAPLVVEHCSSCHQPGTGAPFPLHSYRDVSKRAKQIERVTRSRYMPPWLPASGVGDFQGRRQLTERELEAIQHWVKSGAPEGPPSPSPAAKKKPEAFAPDFVLKEEQPFVVPAEGLGRYHTFVYRFKEQGAQYVRGLRLRSSDPRVVHGAMFLADPSGLARSFDDHTAGPGYASVASIGMTVSGSLGASSFGSPMPLLPEGYAWKIPGPADLSVQVHFNCIGREVPLRSSLEVYLPKSEVTHPVTTVTMGNLCLDIPAGEANHRVAAHYTCPVDLELVGLFPEAYFIARSIEVWATPPSGDDASSPESRQRLLSIPDWDCNWMQSYFYRSPLALTAGTTITVEFSYDNSTANLRNPFDPPQRVQLGHLPDGEVALLLLHVAPQDSEDLAAIEESHRRGFAERSDQRARWRER